VSLVPTTVEKPLATESTMPHADKQQTAATDKMNKIILDLI
jgi:hypothetical protein